MPNLILIFVVLISYNMSFKKIQSPDQLQLPISYGVTDKPFVTGAVRYNPNPKKYTDEQIIESYSRLRNVWKVGKELGIAGQTVQARLVKAGVDRNNPHMTEPEILRIREVYESGIMHGDGKLKELSDELNRTIPFISRFAGRMGLTTYSRQHTDEAKKNQGKRTKKWIKKNGHPRGMLGKTHTAKVRENVGRAAVWKWMSITNKEHQERVYKARLTSRARGVGNHTEGDHKKTWKGQWAQVGPHYHYFRSSWEIRYAQYLEEKRQNGDIQYWEPEESTFFFEDTASSVRSYMPDFTVQENDYSETYHEVKGWMDDRSKRCLELMDKEYPNIKLVVIDKKEFKRLFGTIKPILDQEALKKTEYQLIYASTTYK